MAVFGKLLAVVAVAVTTPTAFATSTQLRTNPIRKVVTMLQAMQKKVTEEGEKSEKMFEQFECYCKNSGGDLTTSISAAEAKVEELPSAIEAAKSKLEQLKTDLKNHLSDRESANSAMAEATSIREKEKAAFDKEFADSQANLAALKKAVTAIENGMSGGSFLQSSAVGVLKAYLSKQEDLDGDRQELLSFLSGEQSTDAPASGAIVGILKEMGDEMRADQKDMISREEDAVQTHAELVAAKKKEIAALTKSIEDKQERLGTTGIEIAEMKNDLSDTAAALEQDKTFIRNLEKNCGSKAKVHEEEKKMRAQEVVALSETIEYLNKDDALELFKKTLPSAGSSFLQMQTNTASMRTRAHTVLAEARKRVKPSQATHLDFISLALSGKKVGFDKILVMVDELVATLKQEQQNDDHKKEYCDEQFDSADDAKKGLQQTIKDTDTAMADINENIETLTEEITALQAGVVALDKSVGEATQQRQNENKEFKELMASNAAAKEIIVFAGNRLDQFYNPTLARKTGLVPHEEGGREQYPVEEAFVQLSSLVAPPPPPETMDAYTKKGGESNEVLEMMKVLVKELDQEMVVAETEEKHSQEEYGQTMSDAKMKRATDLRSASDRRSAKADMKTSLEENKANKKATEKELMAADSYLMTLRSECDWLMQYFDVRKEARADEIDSLEKAKAVLNGADYSFVQETSIKVRVRKHLRHTVA